MAQTDVIFSNDSLQVTIGTTGDEDVGAKELIKIKQPQSSANWGSGKKDTKIVDMLRIDEELIVDGYLATDYGTGDTSSSAQDKKDDLKSIFKAGGTFTVNYEGSDITVNVDKWSIKRIIVDGIDPAEGEAGFNVKLALTIGINL